MKINVKLIIRFIKVVIQYIKDGHKWIKSFLNEVKIYFETILVVGLSIVTINVSKKANEISERQTVLSEKQTELTEIQTDLVKIQTELTKTQEKIAERELELSENEYKLDYYPRLVLKSVDSMYENLTDCVMSYYIGRGHYKGGVFDLDLFTQFDKKLFESKEFYLFIQENAYLKEYFYDGISYFKDDQNNSVPIFDKNKLDVDKAQKEILNYKFEELFSRSGKLYEIENVGIEAINMSIAYWHDAQIVLIKDGETIGMFYLLVGNGGLEYEPHTYNGKIISIRGINRAYYEKQIITLEFFLRQKIKEANMDIDILMPGFDSKYVFLDYEDVNGEYKCDQYWILDDMLYKINTDYDKLVNIVFLTDESYMNDIWEEVRNEITDSLNKNKQ